MIKTGKAGSGVYGVVYTAKMDQEYKKEVAVKRNIVDKTTSFSGSIKELDILNKLRGHPYIAELLYVSIGNPFSRPNSPIKTSSVSYKDDNLYFIFEKADMDGFAMIHESDIHIVYLKLAMVNLLLALEYMHSRGIIHRDLKPSNLLWLMDKDNPKMKICDFGLSKIYSRQIPQTPGVVTSWYRAPEICAKMNDYTKKVDIWSAGCILFEMVSKCPFMNGSRDDNKNLLSEMIGRMPHVSKEEIKYLTKNNKIKLTQAASPRHRFTFREQLNLNNKQIEDFNSFPLDGAKYPEFLDLLDCLLVLDPRKRFTATDALNHHFFKPYKYIIDWTRKNYNPQPLPPHNIFIIDCPEKKWASRAAFTFYNKRKEYSWYNHRIIFQSLSIFDRFLYYYTQNICGDNNKQNSKYIGKYMTKYTANLKYLVCLYISIKYFTTLKIQIPFTDIINPEYNTNKALIEAEQFELELIRDILQFNIYQDTPLEIADKLNITLSEYNIRDLLLIYGQYKTNGETTAGEIFNKFIEQTTGKKIKK